MAHHGNPPSPLNEEDLRLGATGAFPRGKLVEHDEGEIRIAIGTRNGAVVIDFGTPTTWVGFTPDQADEISATLRLRALEVRVSES